MVGAGVAFMKLSKPVKKKGGRPKKTPTKESPPTSPTVTRKAAKGTGSVKTPAGRRPARIARKSLEHDD